MMAPAAHVRRYVAGVVTAACLWLATTAVAQDAGEVLSFARAVELAGGSSAVGAAETQLELARLTLEAALYPVSASASGGLSSSSDFTGEGTSVSLELSLSASLRVGWGATGEAVAAAQRAFEAAQVAVEAARTDAVQQVVRLYGEALATAATRDAAVLQLEVARLQLEAARDRVRAGAALPSDVTQAELTEKSAELDLGVAETALASAHRSLSSVLGVNVSGVELELSAGSVPSGLDAAAEGSGWELAEGWLARRADVRAAERELAAAEDSLAQARRASGVSFSTNASLSASAGSTSFSLGGSIDTRDQTPSLTSRLSTSMNSGGASGGGGDVAWRAGLSVSASVPLGPPDTRVASAEATLAQAQARLEQVISAAQVEVAAFGAVLHADAVRWEIAYSRAALTRQAAEDARTRLGLGLVSSVDVLQADVTALQAEAQVRAARINYLQDLLALASAVGSPISEVLR